MKLSSLVLLVGWALFFGSGCQTTHLASQVAPAQGIPGGGKPDRHGYARYDEFDQLHFVRTTSYTCTEDDHLEYGSNSAAGTPLKYGRVISVAADWSRYPYGTVFRMKGVKNRLFYVDDYGSALVGTNTLDIYMPNKKMMNRWGRQDVVIEIVRWGSWDRSAEILASRLHHPHCRQMAQAIRKQQVTRSKQLLASIREPGRRGG
ncbi:MAG: 3D domain-containing protein [Verrucomicrobiota bacterium]